MTQPKIADLHPLEVRSLLAAAENSTARPNQTVLKALARGEPLPPYRVENWLCGAGCSGLWMGGALLADWPAETTYPRPRARSTLAMGGGGGVTAARFVAYLLKLHRLGIDAGARAAVDALRPSLAKREFLTAAELRVWWAPKEMDRFKDPLVISTTAEWAERVTVTGKSGHVVTAAPNREGRAVIIGHGIRPSRRKLELQILSADALSAAAAARRREATT